MFNRLSVRSLEQDPSFRKTSLFATTRPRSVSLSRTRARPHLLLIAYLCVVAAAFACGSPLERRPTQTEGSSTVEWGHVSVALTAEAMGSRYALKDAQFEVTGPESVTLNTSDASDESSIVQELESGEYTIELLPGYRLVELTPDGESEVDASLETINPQTVLITPNQTTPLTYLFRTRATAIPFGDGTLELTVSVEQAAPTGLFFTELMLNPAAVGDAAGEWMEITNTAEVALDLNGCTISRDSSSFAVEQSLVVGPNEAVTLANSTDPGFVPNYVYSSLTLPNSSVFSLTLECNGTQWDSLTVDPASFPIVAGASTALDPNRYSSTENDDSTFWCVSTEVFALDYGSPGLSNLACGQELL